MPKRAHGSRTTPGARSASAPGAGEGVAPARTTQQRAPSDGAGDALATRGTTRARPARGPSPGDATRVRWLFWENVVREMLMALAARSLLRRDSEGQTPAAQDGAGRGRDDDELLDGRIVLLTRSGVRVPVGDVAPLFPCGVMGPARDRTLSELVQCTVFQVRSPEGEVFTLPISEIRTIVTLSESTMRRLEDSAAETQRDRPEDGVGRVPFGFAAFTSLARGQAPEQDPASWNSPVNPD